MAPSSDFQFENVPPELAAAPGPSPLPPAPSGAANPTVKLARFSDGRPALLDPPVPRRQSPWPGRTAAALAPVAPPSNVALPSIPSRFPGLHRIRRYRAHHYLWMLIGWATLATVAGLVYLRWQPVDDVLTIALVGLTPFLAVPLAVGFFSAWFSRSPVLRAATAAVAVAFGGTVAPFDAVIGCQATEAADAITIMTANVLVGGGDPGGFADTVVGYDPDILVMEEVGAEFLEPLSSDPRMAVYLSRSQDYPEAGRGNVVWSKHRFSQLSMTDFAGPRLPTAVVETPQGAISVTAVHTAAPAQPGNVPTWLEQFELLKAYPRDSPSVLAGDFNATKDHKPFRDLLARGWTDVHDDKGCGLDATWPTGGLPLAILRLDHVLVTDHFEVLDVELGPPNGSDHKPVIAKVRLIDGS